MPNKLLYGGWAVVPEAKTADYTIKPRDCGKIFTNRGATGTVIFTLPKAVANLKGFNVEFFTVAAQILRVSSNPADLMVSTALADASSVASIAAIGTHLRVICDGTGWLVEANPGTVSGGLSVQDVTVTA
jgi:hypothetical protein